MALIPHITSTANVTVFLDGKQHVVPTGTAQYELVIKAINAQDHQGVRDAINVRAAVVNLSQGKITLEGTTLKYDGRPLHNSLKDRILSVIKDAGDAGPLLLFLENIMQNPSKRAVDELFNFLEKCNLPITEDGYFLAYKKIRSDWKDIHSGTMDNSVGQILSVPRNTVDEDKDRTCSTGLHFCSKSYLPNFGTSAGNRVVVLKINPADVVAIPSDYNDAKGRACRYEVLAELTSDGRDVAEEIKANYESKYASKVTAPVAPAPLVVNAPKVKQATSGAVGSTSLTPRQVREVRSMLADSWSLVGIAKAVGTSARTVARIRDGETYQDVV